MKYYKIQSALVSYYGITECPRIPKPSRHVPSITFREGQSIERQLPNPLIHKVDYPDNGTPAPFLERLYPVVGEAFIQAMKQSGVDNYQLFPAQLLNPETGKTWDGYHVFNVVGLRDAADLEASKYDTIMGGAEGAPGVLGFHKYVFAAEKLRDEPRLFRLPYDKGKFFISDHVMQVLKSIMPLSDWNISATEITVK